MTNNRSVEGNNVSGPQWRRRRMYGGIAGWSVAAAAAGGLGLAAVSLLGNDLGTGAVAYAGTAPSVSATADGTSTVQSGQQAAWTAGMFSTLGGQIIARCVGGTPSVTVVPVTNWNVQADDRQSGTGAEVVLTSGRQRIEVHVGCSVSGPTFGLQDGQTSGAPATGTTTAPPVTTLDDHGRHGEVGDDHGSSTAPATSTGADDHGDKGAEAGDDNGGADPAAGDDKGSTSSTKSAGPSTTASTTAQNHGSRSSSSSSSPTRRTSAGASSTSEDNAGSGRDGSGSGGSGHN